WKWSAICRLATPDSPKPIGVWSKRLCLVGMPRFYVQEGISIESATTENGCAAELPKESPGEYGGGAGNLNQHRGRERTRSGVVVVTLHCLKRAPWRNPWSLA